MDAEETHTTEPALPALLASMKDAPLFAGIDSTGPMVADIVDNDGDNRALVNIVLRDAGLTAKLMRLANASSRSKSSVATVDGAISVLGLGAVGKAAQGLPSMEALTHRAQLRRLHAEMIAAAFCGNLAGTITRHNGGRFKPQESQVCGVLQNLGRVMATYYLYERIEKAHRRQIEKNLSETEAIQQALGRSFEELSGGIAQDWQFPDTIQQSLAAGKGKHQPKHSPNPADWLQACPLFARQVTNILFRMSDDREKSEISSEANFFRQALMLKNEDLQEWIEDALRDTSNKFADLGYPMTLEQARTELRKASERTADIISPQDSLAKAVGGMKSPIDRINIAMRMLHAEYDFDLTMVVLPEGNGNAIAITGIGRHANHVVPKFHCVDTRPDLVRLMMAKGSDIYVPDTTSQAFSKLLPHWYHSAVGADSFQLTSMVRDGKVRGILYGDYSKSRPAEGRDAKPEGVQKWLDMIMDALDSK